MKKNLQPKTHSTIKNKIYNLLSSAKQGLFALALTVFSVTAYSQVTYTFNYTGSVQTVTLLAGSYSIECWGGDGGAGDSPGVGGKGGYSNGVYTLATTTTLYIYVGGKGQSNGTSGTAMVTAPGGWNGGGGGFSGSPSTNFKGGGGGGSDVRTTQNTIYSNRVIVAGGGGGGGGATSAGYIGSGGNGGGTSGQNGILGTSQVAHNGLGGTQTAGGAGGIYGTSIGAAGTFGIGGDGGSISGNIFPAGGGGGGYYGGGGGATQGGGGGGGSGYIGGVTGGTTTLFGQTGFAANTATTGNGMVIIRGLCSISLVPSTTNSLIPFICSGQSLTLTTNAISNYSWSTGATTSSLVVAPTTSTVYALTATSPSNCTASANVSVTVSSGQPTLSVVSSTPQTCLGKTVTLTATGAVTYTWTNNVTNGVSFSPSVTTVYSVTGQNGCGTNTAAISVSVGPLPVSISLSPTLTCAGNPATITSVSGGTAFTWSPNNTILTSSCVVAPTVSTVYSLAVSDGTCLGTASVALSVNPIPTVVAATTNSQVCAGATATITASGGISYTWTPGGMNGFSVVVTPTAPTLYSVAASNSFGCMSGASQVLLTQPSPSLNLSASSVLVCANDQVTLTVTGADTYTWANGGSNANVITPNVAASTIFSVSGSNTINCSSTQTIEVDVFTPTVTISGNTPICSGKTATITGNGADNYVWNNASFSNGNLANYTPTITTTYTLSTTTSSNAVTCPNTVTFQITVNPKPVVVASGSQSVICKGETNTITASGASTYTWNALGGGNNPSFVITGSVAPVIVIYSVTGTNASGCVNGSSLQITVNVCAGISSVQSEKLFGIYPNPNSGEFTIESSSAMNLRIVNELGQAVRTVLLDNQNHFKTEVRNLVPGMYFILNEQGTMSKKIVVEK